MSKRTPFPGRLAGGNELARSSRARLAMARASQVPGRAERALPRRRPAAGVGAARESVRDLARGAVRSEPQKLEAVAPPPTAMAPKPALQALVPPKPARETQPAKARTA